MALELDPENSTAYNNRGYARRKLGKYDLAVEDYTAGTVARLVRSPAPSHSSLALQREPDNLRTLNNRGYAYARMNRFDCAIEDYTRAIGLDPQNGHSYHNRGILYEKLGEREKAQADLRLARDLNNNLKK